MRSFDQKIRTSHAGLVTPYVVIVKSPGRPDRIIEFVSLALAVGYLLQAQSAPRAELKNLLFALYPRSSVRLQADKADMSRSH